MVTNVWIEVAWTGVKLFIRVRLNPAECSVHAKLLYEGALADTPLVNYIDNPRLESFTNYCLSFAEGAATLGLGDYKNKLSKLSHELGWHSTKMLYVTTKPVSQNCYLRYEFLINAQLGQVLLLRLKYI